MPHRSGGKIGLGLSPRGKRIESFFEAITQNKAFPYPSELRNKMCPAKTLGIIDEIATLVSDQLQVVSYKWLSRNFLVSSNTAKRLLQGIQKLHLAINTLEEQQHQHLEIQL